MNRGARGQDLGVLRGRFTGWPPPVMAALWSLLRRIAEGPVTMLIYHLVLHWAGFALIADSLLRQGRVRAAWLALAAGAFPLFLLFDGGIWKDVGMASALLCAFALRRWYLSQDRRMPWAVGLLALALLAYGVLVRTNAVFAFGPLAVYALGGRAGRAGAIRMTALALVLAVAMVPVSGWINRHLFDAESSGAMRSLQIFDMAGIARQTAGASAPLQTLTGQAAVDIERCYTPYWWDSFSPWGHCRQIWEQVAQTEQSTEGATGRAWLSAIAANPWAYARHRLAHFNSMLYFIVPADHYRFAPSLDGSAGTRPFSVKLLAVDFAKRNPLFWPMVWLVLGVGALAVTWRAKADDDVAACRALVLSGLLYTAAYLPIGVATSMRYHYWLMMSHLVALIIVFPHLLPALRARARSVSLTAAALLLVVLGGAAARIFDLTFLVR